MQMIFQRPVSLGPAVRPQPRRGTFALEPVEALPRLAERIGRLAERALETNPFFLPEFLEPAIQGLRRKGLRLAIYSDREDVHFFAPVVATRGSFLGARSFSVWTHAYAPLGTPLIDRDMAVPVADGLLRHMRTSGRTLLAIPDLPLQGAAARALSAAAARRGFWTVAGRQLRPILHLDQATGLADFDRMVSQKRRKELDRQLRRLCEAGSVSLMSARTASEIEAAFNMFIVLEASGWKGQRGTALKRRRAVHEFARIAVTQLAQNGRATIDVMRVGDRPIAALIRFDHAGLSVPWKIAIDEGFAAFSPGKQLMCDETRRWLADPTVDRVDPVCEPDNPLIAPLWPDREPYGTLIISTRRLGFGARLRAGLINLRSVGRRGAKILIRAAQRPKRDRQRPQSRSQPTAKPGAPRRR
jgi:CelD/BcsL family acetyltransferase involved in cellulose biosynthesis